MSTRSSEQLVADFATDIRRDLALAPKQLQSKYLYDALGSSLFEAICRLPWYRITRAERALLDRHAPEIVARLCAGAQARDDFRGVAIEQGPLRARDAIPGQPADRLEEARPERVVEILRLQLLRRQREVAPDVGGEISYQLF